MSGYILLSEPILKNPEYCLDPSFIKFDYTFTLSSYDCLHSNNLLNGVEIIETFGTEINVKVMSGISQFKPKSSFYLP